MNVQTVVSAITASVLSTTVSDTVIYHQPQPVPCIQWGDMRQALYANGQQFPRIQGQSESGARFVLMSDINQKVWTVVSIGPDGLACSMDNGRKMEIIGQ